MAEKGLVERDTNEQGRRTFEITPLATRSYFDETAEDGLDVDESGEERTQDE